MNGTLLTDAKLKRIATEFRTGMLANKSSKDMCYAMSQPLSAYLNFLGVECAPVEGLVDGWHHWWVGLSDGRIIDATADQFTVNGKRLDPVIAGTPPEFYKPEP